MNWKATINWMKQNPDAAPGGHDGADLFDAPIPAELAEREAGKEWWWSGDAETGHWSIGDSGYGLNPREGTVITPDGDIVKENDNV